jgi:hypothetical protein
MLAADGDMLQNALTMNKNFTRFLAKEGVGDVQKLATSIPLFLLLFAETMPFHRSARKG